MGKFVGGCDWRTKIVRTAKLFFTHACATLIGPEVLLRRYNADYAVFYAPFRGCHFPLTAIGTGVVRRKACAITCKPRVVHPRQCTTFRSEEHTSELQSRPHLVCRLLLEKKKQK